jgi:hypothetical protein
MVKLAVNSNLPEFSLNLRDSLDPGRPFWHPSCLKIANYLFQEAQICKHFETVFVIYIEQKEQPNKTEDGPIWGSER